MIDNGPGQREERGALRIYRDRANGVLAYWYGAPADADAADPAVLRACNPASWLRDCRVLPTEYARLKARGAMGEWRTYHLNQFVEQLERWTPEAAWEEARATPSHPEYRDQYRRIKALALLSTDDPERRAVARALLEENVRSPDVPNSEKVRDHRSSGSPPARAETSPRPNSSFAER